MGIVIDSEVKTPCTLISGMWKNQTLKNWSVNVKEGLWILEKFKSFNKNLSPAFFQDLLLVMHTHVVLY